MFLVWFLLVQAKCIRISIYVTADNWKAVTMFYSEKGCGTMFRAILKTCTLTLLLFGSTLMAAENDFGHWNATGIKAKINDKASFKSSVEMRMKDNAGDLHYVKWETGIDYKVNKVISLGGYYRLNPSEKSDEWNNAHYILLDQNFKLASNARWDFKFRNRFHLRLGELGRGFWRTKFQLAYKFKIRQAKSSWFIDNEVWYQISDINGRDRFNVDWVTTGFKFALGRGVSLSPYYRLRLDKVTSTGDWKRLHILGTSLSFSF